MKHPNYGQAPGTVAPKNKAPALGNARAENKSGSQTDFKPLDFTELGLYFIWVEHDRDCPGAVGKVSQCKCHPKTEVVTPEEFQHRIRLEAKHGL